MAFVVKIDVLLHYLDQKLSCSPVFVDELIDLPMLELVYRLKKGLFFCIWCNQLLNFPINHLVLGRFQSDFLQLPWNITHIICKFVCLRVRIFAQISFSLIDHSSHCFVDILNALFKVLHLLTPPEIFIFLLKASLVDDQAVGKLV